MTVDSSEFPIITFNSLYNVLREEERNVELNVLPKFFFEAVSEFLIQKEKELSNNHNDSKLKNKLSTANRIFEKLKKIRAKKIAINVIDNIAFDELPLDKKEKDFKDKITQFYKEFY